MSTIIIISFLFIEQHFFLFFFFVCIRIKGIYGRIKHDYHAKQKHEEWKDERCGLGDEEGEKICSKNEALPMDDKEEIEDLIYMRITSMNLINFIVILLFAHLCWEKNISKIIIRRQGKTRHVHSISNRSSSKRLESHFYFHFTASWA